MKRIEELTGINVYDQFYFTDKYDYESKLEVTDYSTIKKVLTDKYDNSGIDNIPPKPIHLYLVDRETYSKPNFKKSMIKPLYPKIPSNLVHLLDSPLYPAYF